ncbi:sulfotransferase family protein [Thermaurantiacus sp.]
MAHPLSGAGWNVLARVCAEAGAPVPRARLLPIVAAILGRLPFTLLEKVLTATRVPPLAALPPPLVILGHWRSGTTHLVNMLGQGDFAYAPPVSVGMPFEMLTLGRLLKPMLERALPEGRFIDQVAVTPTSPQEDEIAIANMSAISFYHGIYFPAACDKFVNRGLFFDGASEADIAAWAQAFTLFTRKVSWAAGCKPALIKNPVYTARPAMLKALLPGAKFIHIHRDPYAVFFSMRNFWAKLFQALALQPFAHVDIDELVLTVYARMMTAFEEEARGWAAPDFVEVAYGDLDARPLETVERIYEALELPGFAAARPKMAAYLATVARYEKNRFRADPEAVAKVSARWAPWIARWGDARPSAA